MPKGKKGKGQSKSKNKSKQKKQKEKEKEVPMQMWAPSANQRQTRSILRSGGRVMQEPVFGRMGQNGLSNQDGQDPGEGEGEGEGESIFFRNKQPEVTFDVQDQQEEPEEEEEEEDSAPQVKLQLDQAQNDYGGNQGQSSADEDIYIGDGEQMAGDDDTNANRIKENFEEAVQRKQYQKAARLRNQLEQARGNLLRTRRKSGKKKTQIMAGFIDKMDQVYDSTMKTLEQQRQILKKRGDKAKLKTKDSQIDTLQQNRSNYKKGIKIFVKTFLASPSVNQMDKKLRKLLTSGTVLDKNSLGAIMGAMRMENKLREIPFEAGKINSAAITQMQERLPKQLISTTGWGAQAVKGRNALNDLKQEMMMREKPAYKGSRKASQIMKADGQKQEKADRNGVDQYWGIVTAKPQYHWNAEADNLMAAFPQWATQEFKRLERSQARYAKVTAPLNMVKNQKDYTLTQLSGLDANLAQWDSNSKSWKGTWVDKKMKSIGNSTARLVQRDAAGRALIGEKITPKERKIQVPRMIQQIISANAAVSDSGFGPISEKPGSLSLYAGRWYDPATGRVRQLPHASQKYVNPSSRPQMLAYLQASIVNDWNLLVGKYQRYKKVEATSNKDFRQAAVKSIKKKLNIGFNSVVAVKRINQIILNFNQGDMIPTSLRWQILAAIPSETLEDIYHSDQYVNKETKQTKSMKIQKEQDQVNIKKINQWTAAVNQAAGKVQTLLKQKQKKGKINRIAMDKVLLKLARAQVSLTSFGTSSVVNGIKQLGRCLLIPQRGDASTFVQVKEKLDELDTQLKKWPAKSLGYRSPAQYKVIGERIKSISKEFGRGNTNVLSNIKIGLPVLAKQLGLGNLKTPKLSTALRRIQYQKESDSGKVDNVLKSLQPGRAGYAQQYMRQREGYKRVGGQASDYLIPEQMEDD